MSQFADLPRPIRRGGAALNPDQAWLQLRKPLDNIFRESYLWM